MTPWVLAAALVPLLAALPAWLLPARARLFGLGAALASVLACVWGILLPGGDPIRPVLALGVALVGIAALAIASEALVAGLLVLLAAELVSVGATHAFGIALAWSVSTGVGALLVWRHGGLRREWAAGMFAAFGFGGAVAFAFAIDWLATHVATTVPTSSFELATLIARAQAFGWWGGDGVFLGLLLVAVGSRLPIVPVHGWTGPLQAEAPGPVAMVAAAGHGAAGFVVLVDLGLGGAPVALRSLAPIIALVGLGQFAWGAFLARAQRDAHRFTAHLSLATAGLALAGFASLVPQGLDGATLAIGAHTLAIPLSTLVVGALHARFGHRRLDGFGGLITSLAPLAVAAALAWLGLAGLPIGGALAGWVLVFTGTFANHPAATLAAAAAGAVFLAATVEAWWRTFLAPDPARPQPIVIPVTRAELAALLVLAVATVPLSFTPGAVLRLARPAAAARVQAVVNETPWP